jgi:DNA polymerase-3 subunit gamma/tau
MFGAESFVGVAEAVLTENGHRMLEIVQELENNGRSLQHFCRELARYWRNLLVAKIAGQPTRLIGASDREQQSMIETASQFGEEDLTRYLHLTLDLFKSLQVSLQPRFHLELGLVKLVQVGKLQAIEEALTELTAASPAPPSPTLRASAPAPRTGIARLAPSPAKAPPVGAEPAVKSASPVQGPEKPVAVDAPSQDLKARLEASLIENGLKMSADAVQHSDVRVEGSELVFITAKTFALALRDVAVVSAASALLGRSLKVRVEIDASVRVASPPVAETSSGDPPRPAADDISQRALSHPDVKRFQELFPGAHVRIVRNLNE